GAGVNPWRNNAYDLGGGNYYGLANFWTIRKPVFCKALNSILGTTRDGGTVEIYAPSSALSFSFYWVPEAYYVEQGKNINTLMKQTGIFRIGPGGNCVKRLSWPLA
ncbi:hypothetical protein COU36_01165, partial [Candidatus Micrarchaeota archaeon CG10_big_fil_rev_8_21_14_0_10_59_7]